jgi:hypothetical protein
MIRLFGDGRFPDVVSKVVAAIYSRVGPTEERAARRV